MNIYEGNCCNCNRDIRIDSSEIKGYYICPKCNSFLYIEVIEDKIFNLLWDDFLDLKSKNVERETIDNFEFLEKKGKALTSEQKARVQGIIL